LNISLFKEKYIRPQYIFPLQGSDSSSDSDDDEEGETFASHRDEGSDEDIPVVKPRPTSHPEIPSLLDAIIKPPGAPPGAPPGPPPGAPSGMPQMPPG